MTTTINYNSATLEVKTDDRSYRYRQLMGEDSVTLIFSLTYYIELPVGAFIDYQGQRYTMLTPQNFKKISNTNYEYTLVLEAAKGAIAKYKFKDTASNRLKFPLTAKPAEFLNMLVANMNMRETGWIAGDCIDAAEKTVNFSFNYCDEALQMIADAFETEWHIDNKTIHLKKIEYNKATPLQLSYGKGNGFKSGIKRDNNSTKNKAIEILYTQGGERNIDPSKYGSKQLLLPINQTYTLNGKQYITDANGYSIRRNDKTLVTKNEGSLDCSDIYPQREGTISSVVAVNTAKNFYDIIDTEIPDALNYTNNIIKGETMTVIFQTGMLAGREFEVKYYHTAIGSKAAKRFEIVPQEIDGQTMPNETFKPAAGNKYKVFHIEMPGAYIRDNATQTGAEWDMLKKAAKYMAENENQDFTFNGQLDPIWSETNWLNIGGKIKIGGFVSFSDASIIAEGVLIRIIGIKDFMTKPYQPELELSNAPVSVSVSSVIGKLETTEVAIETAKTEGVQFTKRSYRSAKETMDALSEAMQNYSGAINPVAIQTMQMLVGDESLQLRFVNSKTAPVEIDPVIQWIQASKTLSINSTIIQHMTLGIDTISNSHAVNEYKFWNMAAYQSPAITDATKKYFIYAKVSKTAQTGVFTISETAIAIEGVTGYYHLLIGLLNSEYEDTREINLLYGFTEILPSRITTNRIVSNDGNTYFDLLNNEFKGNFKFKSGAEYIDIAGKVSAIDILTNGLQNQIDGQVISWFKEYDPTTANQPASTWTTSELKQQHANDTFTNTLTGGCWRWQWDNPTNSWIWGVIADTATQQALAAAVIAQDTADGKRRVFVAEPTTPYDVGDLWAQGTTGDLMKCKQGRVPSGTTPVPTGYLTGNYTAGDWEKASKYTDDSGLDTFVSNTYATDKSGLQTQIDGKIETYFQTSDPNTWGVVDRPAHNGDMWYNSTTNLLKRYNGTSNSWELIQDQKAIDAYNTAAAAKDTADGKRRVFVAQPTTPYDVGDLWVQGTAGEIMRCSVARATGAYTASDWVKASKYTDDTAANAAQATANAAQSSAATALSKLTDIADDNKLTPGEKQMVKKEWDIIAAEYQKVCDYADIYGQSFDGYTDAYVALSSYITPKLADLTTNSDITPASQFRQVFQEYYSTRQDIYNSVATAAKSYTDNSIASIYVGGENMILNHRQTLTAGSNNYFYSLLYGTEYSQATAILGSISSDNYLTASEKSTVKAEWDAIAYQYPRVMATARINGASSTAYASAYAALEAYITPLLANMSVDSYISGSTFRSYFDSYYTARQALLVASSAYLKNSTPYVFSVGSAVLTQGSAASLTLRLYDFYTGQEVMLTNVALSANRQIIKFTTPWSGNWSLIIYAGVVAYTAGNTVNLSQLMLQTGDKATAFSPAVRHVSDAMQGSTDIIGGLVATNLLMMKDAAGNIRGGLSGLQDDNVGMWTGGSYADALAGIAKIILKKDGAGQLAGGKINWDAAGAMNVGLFNIFSNLLSSGNISFTSEALENLASIGGSTTNIASPGSTSAASYNSYTASLSSAQFTLTKNSLVKFRVPRSLTIVASDYATCNIYVKNSANSTVYASNRDKSATSNSSDNYDYAVNLQAGTYYVVVEIKLNGTNSGNSQTVSITGYNGVGSTISIEPISTLTKIASNGMYSYWGASAYMFIRTDYGFEVRFGNFGIQVTTSGLKKMTDGVNWVTL